MPELQPAYLFAQPRGQFCISANEDESSGSSTPDRFSLWHDCAKCCLRKFALLEVITELSNGQDTGLRWSAIGVEF
jgi:hypothetical protein